MRPWVGAKMAGFGARGTRIADSLALRDGIGPAANTGPTAPTVHAAQFRSERIPAGRMLSGVKGLGLRQLPHGQRPLASRPRRSDNAWPRFGSRRRAFAAGVFFTLADESGPDSARHENAANDPAQWPSRHCVAGFARRPANRSMLCGAISSKFGAAPIRRPTSRWCCRFRWPISRSCSAAKRTPTIMPR